MHRESLAQAVDTAVHQKRITPEETERVLTVARALFRGRVDMKSAVESAIMLIQTERSHG